MIEGEEKERIKHEVENILSEEFSDRRKMRVMEHSDRLNFSCPYCGDSAEDPMKKRGNLFLDTGYYHCFNDGCGKHVHVLKFLRQHGKSTNDTSFTFRVMNSVDKGSGGKRFSGNVQRYVGAFAALDSMAVPVDDFMKSKGLIRIGDSPKLRSRLDSECLYADETRQAFSPRNGSIFYLNVNSEGNVVGYQEKPFASKGRARFFSAGLKRLLQEMSMPVDVDEGQDLDRLDQLSNVFNILVTDFSSPFYIFEGPSDALLLSNTVGKQGIMKGVDLGKERSMYVFDYEKEALKIMRDMAKKGYSVFEWTAFLRDHSLKKNRKWDLRDLFKEARSRNDKEMVSESNLRSYFTQKSLDIVHV